MNEITVDDWKDGQRKAEAYKKSMKHKGDVLVALQTTLDLAEASDSLDESFGKRGLQIVLKHIMEVIGERWVR